MKSKESELASQIRLKQWAEQIHDCMNRPADMTVEEWCEKHGIKKANYYWRLKRVRQACMEQAELPAKAFVELPVPKEECSLPAVTASKMSPENKAPVTVAVLRAGSHISVEITEHASMDFIKNLIGVLSNAE